MSVEFSTKDYIEILKRSYLFSSLTEDEILSVLSCLDAKKRDYKKDELIIKTGEKADSIAIVLSGSVLITEEDFWGRRNIIAVVKESDTFLEAYLASGEKEVFVNASTQNQTSILFLNFDKLLNVCPSGCKHHNTMLTNLLKTITKKNIILSNKISHLAKRTTREKLISYLSSEAIRHNSNEFDIPFTREELADYLSVDRSGLSTELGKMIKEGLIKTDRKHFILYRD